MTITITITITDPIRIAFLRAMNEGVGLSPGQVLMYALDGYMEGSDKMYDDIMRSFPPSPPGNAQEADQ